MKLRCALRSEMHRGLTHPAGAEAHILEELDQAHVLIEVRIPDPSLVGGATYDVLSAKREDLDDEETVYEAVPRFQRAVDRLLTPGPVDDRVLSLTVNGRVIVAHPQGMPLEYFNCMLTTKPRVLVDTGQLIVVRLRGPTRWPTIVVHYREREGRTYVCTLKPV